MTPQNGTGPPGLEAITMHGAYRAGSNCNAREWYGLAKLQEAELDPSCAKWRDGEEDEP